MSEIKNLSKVYLAIPYSGMRRSSYKQATYCTAILMNKGNYNVFSPITHSHPLTKYKLRGDWAFWEQVDYQYIDWADEVFVLVPKEGLQKVFTSTGVVAEIKYATSKNKPITFIEIINDKIVEYGRGSNR